MSHLPRRARLRGALVATALAVALIAAPAAAQAATIYPPEGSCTVTPATTTPGGTATLACKAATFSGSEKVTITVTGENGSGATIGMVRFAVSTASGSATSQADGSLTAVKITFPQNASGTYNIAAFSATSAGSSAAVTVTNADGSLPTTGIDSTLTLGLWIGGIAILVVGVALAIAAAVRRRRNG